MYDKIAYLLDDRQISAYRLSKETGISRSLLSQWKSGKFKPSRDNIKVIAEYFGVPISYFYDDEQVYDVAAGQGRINGDYGEQDGAVKTSSSEYSTVRICGDSMYPSLHDGDLVRVHHVTDDIAPHDFAIVKINGNESTCKHIEITNDGIWLRAENKEVFEDKFYSVQEVLTVPVTIIGKAVSIVERRL